MLCLILSHQKFDHLIYYLHDTIGNLAMVNQMPYKLKKVGPQVQNLNHCYLQLGQDG